MSEKPKKLTSDQVGLLAGLYNAAENERTGRKSPIRLALLVALAGPPGKGEHPLVAAVREILGQSYSPNPWRALEPLEMSWLQLRLEERLAQADPFPGLLRQQAALALARRLTEEARDV